MCNGDTIDGSFFKNEPHGFCKISLLGDNIIYHGNMEHGKR